jgi:hypothetical protein
VRTEPLGLAEVFKGRVGKTTAHTRVT